MKQRIRIKAICIMIAVMLLSAIFPLGASAESLLSGDDLDMYIRSEFEKTHIPNMSVEIVDANSVIFTGDYGERASADAPFILGSISKSFTALAIMQLAEQGKLDVDDAAVSYLPDVMDSSSKTTIRQLLNHTSGIRTNMTLEDFSSSDMPVGYEYANVNYNLLGLIIEKVSGMSYGEYVKSSIFEPLGMRNSCVSLEDAKTRGIITGVSNDVLRTSVLSLSQHDGRNKTLLSRSLRSLTAR